MRYIVGLLICLMALWSSGFAEEEQAPVVLSTPAQLIPVDQQLEIGYFSTVPINRALGDALCLNFELLESGYQCNRQYIEQMSKIDPREVAEQYDLLILSESDYNQAFRQQYQLLLPIYHKSFVAVTHASSELSIFDQEQTFGVLNVDNQVDKIVGIFNLLGIKKAVLDIESFRAADLLDRFCNFDIDVVFTVSTHPDAFIRNLNTACDAELKSVTDALPANFFQRNRYLYKGRIPKAFYWRIDRDIETLSERYFLAAHRDLNDQLLTRLLDQFLDELGRGHSVVINLQGIIDNFQNNQTPLSPLGEIYMERLTAAMITHNEKKAAERGANRRGN